MKKVKKYPILMILLPALMIFGVFPGSIYGCLPNPLEYIGVNVTTDTASESLNVGESIIINNFTFQYTNDSTKHVIAYLSYTFLMGSGIDVFWFTQTEYDNWSEAPSHSGASLIDGGATGPSCYQVTHFVKPTNKTTYVLVIANIFGSGLLIVDYTSEVYECTSLGETINDIWDIFKKLPGFEPLVYIALFGLLGAGIITMYRVKFKNAFK